MKELAHLDARRRVLRELQTIPSIGPSLAQDLYALGIRRVADLTRRKPETLYRRLEQLTNSHQDRCVLYTFRCAVYYARTPRPDPRRLLWWNWKDAPRPAARKSRQLKSA
jgi:hypothetical protein